MNQDLLREWIVEIETNMRQIELSNDFAHTDPYSGLHGQKRRRDFLRSIFEKNKRGEHLNASKGG